MHKSGPRYAFPPNISGNHLTPDSVRNQTLALAGVFQAAALVERLAKTGAVPNENFKASVASLFAFDPENTAAVFGGDSDLQYGLSLGLTALRDVFDRKRGAQKLGSTVSYVMGLLHLERMLRRNRVMLDQLGRCLRGVHGRALGQGYTDTGVIEIIARCYQETLSTLRFRIQVRGEAHFLRDPGVANQVRAALLAGVRSALLWYQVGGRRWQLPFYRKRILETLRKMG